MHYKLRDLVAARVTRYTKPADGKPAFGFAEREQGRSRRGPKESIFFGDRSQSEYLELGCLRIPIGESVPRRGDEIVGPIEPSRRSGGRAKNVYTWWCNWGRQISELARVILKGTALTAQALRRRLRMGTNDALWFIERVILHNDLKLAETLIRVERGYDPDFSSDKEKLIALSVKFDDGTGAFLLLEQLAQEIDIELADFVAQMDGKYPVKAAEGQAPEETYPQHEDAVMPMDASALQMAQPQHHYPAQAGQMPRQDYVGFAAMQPGSWGAQASGWEAQQPYDPASASAEMQAHQPRTPVSPRSPTGAMTPVGDPHAGGQTPDYASPTSPTMTPTYGAAPQAAAGGGGGHASLGAQPASTTPPYMSPVSP